MDIFINQKFNSLHHNSKFHQGFIDNWYGDCTTLSVDFETIKEHLNLDCLFYCTGWFQNLRGIYKTCIYPRENANLSNYVFVGTVPKKSDGNLHENLACLFDVTKNKDKFLDNIVFVPVGKSSQYSEAIGFRFLGQFYAQDNIGQTPQQRNNPVTNAQLILQILGKFDLEKQTLQEQKILATIRENACQTLFDFLREKRNEVTLHDNSKLRKNNYIKDVVKYYKLSKTMSLSEFIEYTEKEMNFLEIKQKESEKKKQRINHPAKIIKEKSNLRKKEKMQKIQEKIDKKQEKINKKNEKRMIDNYKL